MDLSVVIVNYNGKHHLDGCLTSLKASLQGIRSEVIIVDNASVDGSVDYIREIYPEVRLIESKENLGFTGGNNLGVKYAKGSYILLLNNDTVVQCSLQPMLNKMRDKSNLGVLGCHLRYGDGRVQESIGYEHTPLNLVLSWVGISRFTSGKRVSRTVSRDNPAYDTSLVQADWVSGACMMLPHLVWDEIFGFDERYFMYVEDVDLCRRVREKGYEVAYTNSVQVTHFEGGGKVWIGERALVNTSESYCLYVSKFYKFPVTVLFKWSMSFVFFMRSVIFYIYSLLTNDDVKKDKASAYLTAAGLFLKKVRDE